MWLFDDVATLVVFVGWPARASCEDARGERGRERCRRIGGSGKGDRLTGMVCTTMCWHGSACLALAWLALPLLALACPGLAWPGLVWPGLAGTVQYSTEQNGLVRYGTACVQAGRRARARVYSRWLYYIKL